MISKQVEIKLGNDKVLLWFNAFSKYQLMGMYKVNNDLEFAQKMIELVNDNALGLLVDLVKAGIKGECMANNKPTHDIYDRVNIIFAEMPMDESVMIWNDVFHVFKEHMGLNEKPEESKKKVAKPRNTKKATS